MENTLKVPVEVILSQVQYEFGQYVAGRKKDVEAGRESPQLAALLVEKFGYGMTAALKACEIDTQFLYEKIDAAVLEVDANAAENRRKRWDGKPAGLTY